jgi:hypothetical protein
MAALLDEARDRGEMVDGPSRALARAIIAMMRGSLLTWSATGRDLAPDAWVKADLETLLGPYRRNTTSPSVPRPRPARTGSRGTARVAASPARRRRAAS